MHRVFVKLRRDTQEVHGSASAEQRETASERDQRNAHHITQGSPTCSRIYSYAGAAFFTLLLNINRLANEHFAEEYPRARTALTSA